nr:Flp pilus assembly protein CpaB [uncultured Anaeromusa sp.]
MKVTMTNRKLLLVALAISLVTATLAYQYLKGASALKNEGELQTVVVAKSDIIPKTRLTAEMLKEEKVPGKYAQPGAITSLSSLVGVVAKDSIGAGEQITERRLLLDMKGVGFTGIIPANKRAMALAVNDANSVGGLIKAGDYVDALVTFDSGSVGENASRMLLQKLLVLAVNRETGLDSGSNAASNEGGKVVPKEASKATTVTVAVDPEDASKLFLAQDKGKVALILRPYLPVPEQVITPVSTPRDLVGSYAGTTAKENSPGTPSIFPTASPPVLPPSLAPAGAFGNSGSAGGVMVIRGTKAESVAVN